jgi:hypothetical protein
LAVLADRRLMLPHLEEDEMRAVVFIVERLTDGERALFGIGKRGGGIEFWYLFCVRCFTFLFCVSFGVGNNPLFFSR